MSTLNPTLDTTTAITATATDKELKAQQANIKKTLKAFDKANTAKTSAAQMLFGNFANCFDGEDHEKEFKLAKKVWFAAIGFKSPEELKNETGINLAAYFSIMAFGAKDFSNCYYSFNELRTAYDARPKTKVQAKTKDTEGGAGEGDSDSDSSDVTVTAPKLTGLLLEAVNKASQLSPELQDILANEILEAIAAATA